MRPLVSTDWQLTGRLPRLDEEALPPVQRRELEAVVRARALRAGYRHDRDPGRALEAFLLLRRAGVEIGEQVLAWLEEAVKELPRNTRPRARAAADRKVERLHALRLIAAFKDDRAFVRRLCEILKIERGTLKKVRQRATKDGLL